MQTTKKLLMLLSMAALNVISMTVTCLAQVYSGYVKNDNGSVLSGVTAEVVGQAGIPPVLSDANGRFVLSGIPAGVSAEIKLSKSGYLPVYTSTTQFYGDNYVTFYHSYVLPTQDDFTTWGVSAGKGILKSITYDNNDNPIAATVTATGNSHGVYAVRYGTDCALSTPDSSGIYCVNNVDDADIITVSASYPGYTFTPRTFIGHADAKGQTAIRATITFSFYVKNYSGSFLQGVKAEVADHPEVTPAFSDQNGFITLSGVPASTGDPVEIKLSHNDYLPLYTAKTNYSTNLSNPSSIAFALAKQVNFSTWKITSGKGILQARTRDQDENSISATVTATGSSHVPYTVTYGTNCDLTVPVSNGTDIGKYCVNNVVNGDIITVSASGGDYTFASRAFIGHADALGQSSIKGTSTPALTSFAPTSAKVGDTVIITGSNLTGASVATINGASVAVTVTDSTHASIVVPANATTTGVISISTPHATGTNSTVFTVLPNTLTVSLPGTGSGSVNATSGLTLSCNSPSTSCSASVVYGTSVTLSATSSLGSTFAGWSGACTSNPCTFSMNGDQTSAATFTLQQNIKTGTTYYGTLQSALNTLVDGETLLLRGINFPDNGTVTCNRSGVTATLKGGYDSGFSVQTGYTTLNGALLLDQGCLIVDRLVL
ncbi:MAG: hypothetical protein HXX11_18250 [Desulfuromonadales bacterium]|nr:hypothetical protein [Desulfuromonadales bacterium]